MEVIGGSWVPIQGHPHPYFDFMTELWSWKYSSPLQPCVLGWNSTRTHRSSGLYVTWQRSLDFVSRDREVSYLSQFEARLRARTSRLIHWQLIIALSNHLFPTGRTSPLIILTYLELFRIYLEYPFPFSFYVHSVSRPRSNLAFSINSSWLSLRESLLCTMKQLL